MEHEKPILDYFAERLPEFRFNGVSPSMLREAGSCLVFRRDEVESIYRYFSIQRDGVRGALAVNVTATYERNWRGTIYEGLPSPLGVDTSLARLRLDVGTMPETILERMPESWIFDDGTADGLNLALEQVLFELRVLAEPFFVRAERQLHSNRTLQLALAASRIVPVSEREGLEQQAKKGPLRNLTHPAYLRLRDKLREASWVKSSQEEKAMAEHIACAVLLEIPPAAQSTDASDGTPR